jgi:hypothetical protein
MLKYTNVIDFLAYLMNTHFIIQCLIYLKINIFIDDWKCNNKKVKQTEVERMNYIKIKGHFNDCF